ncbi:RWD domain-containing protein 4-like [Anopheles cruzii]|uniref:RWD domain-containing protein 4-like n=1 Tax=Anopheles cruzii TaxID=68878 RepID=UPI0022EC5CBD|nr:RWD domain-containing protein 4-like [Anopheles cruzii]XP_052871308.1 RWD domain-containing protein 4-like [Anopheles cruzii]
MSDTKELQNDEREALISIYEGDSAFKQVNSGTYQYKYGEEGNKSFLLEICWTEKYPEELPTFNLETFYNRNLSRNAKDSIVSILREEAEQWLGCGMTYTLFECLKDKLDDLLTDENCNAGEGQQGVIGTANATLEEDPVADSDSDGDDDESGDARGNRKEPKREQMTKAQKRKQWDRVDSKGNRQRGWNWVDIVKHLSQTGGKPE